MKINHIQALRLAEVLPHSFASTCLATAENGVSLMLTNAITGFHLTMEWPDGQLMNITPLRFASLFPELLDRMPPFTCLGGHSVGVVNGRPCLISRPISRPITRPISRPASSGDRHV